MKKFLSLLSLLFCGVAIAETLNVTWYNTDNTVYDTTTCTVGGTLTLPTTPTKPGYTFLGWAIYIPIEYVESTGTQYIDTGINFLYGDEFFFDFMRITNYSDEDKGYGAGIDLSHNITGGGRHSGSYVADYIASANLAFSPTLTYSSILGKRYTEHWTISNGVLNSTLTDLSTGDTYACSKGGFTSSFNSEDSVYLFRDHADKFAYPSKTRIYNVWLKRADGTKVFDFFPVLDANGVACMYDKVSQQCFYNSGTGDFVAGPVLTE